MRKKLIKTLAIASSFLIVFVALLLLHFFSLDIGEVNSTRKLLWVLMENPASKASNDIRNKDFRFFGISHYALSVPGVGLLTHERCYKKNVRIERIEGTSDVIYGDIHEFLIDRAWRFAEEYNKEVAKFINSRNISQCNKDEDWDGAFSQLHELTDKFVEIKNITAPENGSVHSFGIQLTDAKNVTRIKINSCEILANNGLTGERAIKLRFTEKSHLADIQSILYKCLNGEIKQQ